MDSTNKKGEEMKIILFDIETAPILAYVWGLYEQNVLSVERPSFLLCFGWKELGKKEIQCPSLPDFKLYKRDPFDDGALVKEMWKVLNDADIVVAHNGDAFDVKKANGFFMKHGLPPPKPYQTVDTLKELKKVAKLDSHKLDAVGDFLKLGRKVHTGGIKLWMDCINRKPQAWAKMVRYCKQDVSLLERAYKTLRPWMKQHPNLSLYLGRDGCPKCGSSHMHSRGTRKTSTGEIPRFQCQNCSSWCSGKWPKGEKPPAAEYRLP